MPLIEEYDLTGIDIQNISKESWKDKVIHNVRQKAFSHLISNINSKSKTKQLSYKTFSPQPYMHQFQHKPASIIFKLRSHSIDCKSNRKSAHADLTCRLCKQDDETQSHIINCPRVCQDPVMDISKVMDCEIDANDNDIEICRRVDEFNKAVNGSNDATGEDA